MLHIEWLVEDLAKQYGVRPEAMVKRIDGLLVRMRAYRAKRVGPGLDDKILTSWNGLMISALATCGRLLREPRYLEAAHGAIHFLLLEHMQRGRNLLRVSRKTGGEIRAHTPAFLEDHAFLLNGLMDLIDATQPTSLPGTMARKRALELADTLVRDFYDREGGGLFFTSAAHEPLFSRIKNIMDGAAPNANATAIRALLRLAQVSGKEQYRELALTSAAAFSAIVARASSAAPTLLHALLSDQAFLLSNPHLNVPAGVEVGVVLGSSEADEAIELVAPLASAVTVAANVISLEPVALPALRAGQTFDLRLVLHIAAGYHIQLSSPRDREAFATVARIRGDLPIAAQEWLYPPGPASELGYSGTITITGRLTVEHSAAAGAYSLRAVVLAQPCQETRCLAPEKVTVDIRVRVVP